MSHSIHLYRHQPICSSISFLTKRASRKDITAAPRRRKSRIVALFQHTIRSFHNTSTVAVATADDDDGAGAPSSSDRRRLLLLPIQQQSPVPTFPAINLLSRSSSTQSSFQPKHHQNFHADPHRVCRRLFWLCGSTRTKSGTDNGESYYSSSKSPLSSTGSSTSSSSSGQRQQRTTRPVCTGTIFQPPCFEDYSEDNEDTNDSSSSSSSPSSSSSTTPTTRTPIVMPRDDPLLRSAIRSCFKNSPPLFSAAAAEEEEEQEDKEEMAGSSSSSGLSRRRQQQQQQQRQQLPLSDMFLRFLGTSSGSPLTKRNTTSTMLQVDDKLLLFDVGEGTQRQLQYTTSPVVLSRIKKIFITHLHGDHIFGLPGLILGLQNASITSINEARTMTKRRKKKPPPDHVDEYGRLVVQIYGPPGLYNYIASSIVLSCTVLHSIRIEVYELVGGRVKRMHGTGDSVLKVLNRHHKRNNSNKRQDFFRNPFVDKYPELEDFGGMLYRGTVRPTNGVWTISDFFTPEEKKEKVLEHSRASPRSLRIRAAEVDHLSGVATFGYVVEEDEHPRNIDAQKAKSLNVSPGENKKYELLKYGFSVLADDGTTEVQPSQVVIDSIKKSPRKLAIVGDNRGWTSEMTNIAQDSDVLVHEATLVEEDYVRGHSTPTMAGNRGADCNAGVLVLNHISPKVEADLPSKVKEAYNATGRAIPVVPAFDFMELQIPWLGFSKNR